MIDEHRTREVGPDAQERPATRARDRGRADRREIVGDGDDRESRAIIDGHDTRLHALSRNDELVKDADKLWRYSTTGVAVGCDFFGLTPGQYADHVERELDDVLFTDAAREIGARDLAQSRAILQADVLA